jgi:hypothetical protein
MIPLPRLVKRGDGFDVSICRPSKWGNPYSHLTNTLATYQVGSIKEAVACYRKWFPQQPRLISDLYELDGQRLACCRHLKPCHGSVLIEMWWRYRGCTGPM